MATRFYLVAATAPSITPGFDAGWNSTSGAVRRTMAVTQAAATEQVTSDIGATGPAYTLSGQFVSPPLAAQTISGTVTITTRGRELASTDNVNKRARAVKVYSGDGTTLRGTLNAWAATTSTTELSPTTLQGQATATGAALTSVTCQDGDVIVVEVGYGVGTSGTTPQATMEWGGVGTDHANSNADVTGSVPWVEFSADLIFQSAPSTVNGTGLAALSFTATAVGVREVPGTAAAGFGFTAAASGLRTVSGTAAVPLTFTADAAGVVSAGAGEVLGTAAAPFAFSAAATGTRTVAGLAATSLTFTASAAGTRTVLGTAAAALAFAASAAGAATTPAAAGVKASSAATVDGGTSSPTVTGPATAATVTAGATSAPVLSARRTSTPEVTRG